MARDASPDQTAHSGCRLPLRTRVFAKATLCTMQETVDKAAVKAVFPYGRICCVDIVDGGLRANSGVALAAMGAFCARCLHHCRWLYRCGCCNRRGSTHCARSARRRQE